MMREAWRVLSASGRILIVVPNRRGIWARVERTPFGTGSPFSPPQLDRLMRETMFSPTAIKGALYLPPTQRRSLVGLAPPVEKLGRRWAYGISGVLISEAGKQIFAVTAQPAARQPRLRRPQVAFPRTALPCAITDLRIVRPEPSH